MVPSPSLRFGASRLLALVAVGLLVGVAAAAAPPKAVAGPVAVVGAALARASAALARGDWLGVNAALDDASTVAGRQLPLTIRLALPTLGPHRGLHVYERLPDGDVVPGRVLNVYLEVDGVQAKAEAGGRFHHELDVKGRFFTVGDQGALELLGEKNLGRHAVTAWQPMPLQAVGVDVVLGDAPAGAYVAELVVTDLASGQEATRQVPFGLR